MKNTSIQSRSIAVVHGNYLRHGGGERVAEELARLFDAPLYYGFSNPGESPPSDIESHSLFDNSPFRRLATQSPSVRDLYYLINWQHVPELYDYDVLIQSGNEMGWFVPQDTQTVVKYVHSTPRSLYDRFPDKGNSLLMRLLAPAMRTLYYQNIPYPDTYVANSELIQRRLERYWGVKSEVVYPPVDVQSYYSAEKENFFLTYSRLVQSKRINEIIEAFEQLPDERLIVGGSGPQAEELHQMAPENVEFRGFLDEDEKRNLLSKAKGLIFAARNEDFGMVPIEAFASGTPVIGVREGYTQIQIQQGTNGYLFDRGTENLVATVEEFLSEQVSTSSEEIQQMATRYSFERFEDRMKSILANAITGSEVRQEI